MVSTPLAVAPSLVAVVSPSRALAVILPLFRRRPFRVWLKLPIFRVAPLLMNSWLAVEMALVMPSVRLPPLIVVGPGVGVGSAQSQVARAFLDQAARAADIAAEPDPGVVVPGKIAGLVRPDAQGMAEDQGAAQDRGPVAGGERAVGRGVCRANQSVLNEADIVAPDGAG